MDFKDFLIYLAMAFLGVLVVGYGISLAIGFIAGAWHAGTSSLHCNECALKAKQFTDAKDEDIYSSKQAS